MTKYLFFLHVENIQLPEGMMRRVNVRMPTTQVSDIMRVVREVWGFPEHHTIELWQGSPGNPQRRRLSHDEWLEEGEIVWIRGRPRVLETPDRVDT